PDNSDPFNNSTSLTFFDSLGEQHVLTSYYIRPENAAYTGESNWVTFYAVDGNPVNVAGAGGSFQTDTDGDGTPETNNTATVGGWIGAVMRYNDTGTFIGSDPAVITTEELGINGAAALKAGADGTQTLTINFNSPTQYASSFEVISLNQDGASVGNLTNLDISADGLITASYSNGAVVPWARVALVRFTNEQGLIQVGNTSWRESLSSGQAQTGEAGSGSFGDIRSSTLEQSNVDLTTELVDLISAQRNFQANSRTLEVNNTLQQTILQIR
ncbi:MAG: flagellar hook-basal body complex protein, partial [Shewanella sp.]|nr:flagellar hook-basal body complex protein [Shewanella sp.]